MNRRVVRIKKGEATGAHPMILPGGPRGERMRRLKHKIAHWLGRNRGATEVWWHNDVRTEGFRCKGCGELTGVRPVPRKAMVWT